MSAHFVKLFHYEYWANKKVLDHLISNQAISEKAISLFAHLLFAHKIWLSRISRPQEDIRENYAKAELLDVLDDNYIEFITSIKNEGDLNRTITYTDLKGQTHTNVLSDILFHVITHGAYHRGQIIQLVKQVSSESIVTDYIAYARLEL
jgi:uncharacterized damage-inducible protein DinB